MNDGYWTPEIGQRVRIRQPQWNARTVRNAPTYRTSEATYRVTEVGSDSDGRPTATLEDSDQPIYTNWLAPLSPLEQLAEAAGD